MPRLAVIGLTGHTVFLGVPHFHVGGETIHATDYHAELGGKGFNQAVAAARQGAEVSFLTAVGPGDVEDVADVLSQERIHGTVVGKSIPSAHATILTDGTGETRVTVFPGAHLEVADVEAFASVLAAADILLLNNEVPEDVNLRASEIAAAHGVRIILNPAPARPLPPDLLSRVSLFTPNEFEEKELLSNSSLNTHHFSLVSEVVTTLGAQGCRIRSTGERVPAPQVTAVDSTGAGDTFNAVLAVQLAQGIPLAAACRVATAAAAQSVTIRYVLPSLPYRKENERC